MSTFVLHCSSTNEVAVMQNFIVLGIVPGTNYQITFSFWLEVVLLLCMVINIPRIIHFGRYVWRTYMLYRIARTISHLDLIAI